MYVPSWFEILKTGFLETRCNKIGSSFVKIHQPWPLLNMDPYTNLENVLNPVGPSLIFCLTPRHTINTSANFSYSLSFS